MTQELKELYYKLETDCGALMEECPNEKAGKRVLACEYCRFEYLRKAIAKEILTAILEEFVFAYKSRNKDYQDGYEQALTDYDNKLKEFFKDRYGVEVEE